MNQMIVHHFKDLEFDQSAFKNAEISYECGGDISYEDNSYIGFICFIPTSQSHIDLYAYENFKDKSLKRLKKKIEFSKIKYASVINDTHIDEKFNLNRSPDPKNGGISHWVSGRNDSGIDLAKIPLPLESKFELFFFSNSFQFLLLFLGLIPLSVVVAYVSMLILAILSYPFQFYIRKITRDEWDLVFYGCLIIAPTLIIMSLRERLAREESISKMNAFFLRKSTLD